VNRGVREDKRASEVRLILPVAVVLTLAVTVAR
jgi:hypothetical protein